MNKQNEEIYKIPKDIENKQELKLSKEENGNKNRKVSKKIFAVIYLILLTIILASTIYIINFISQIKEVNEQRNLLNTIDIDENILAKSNQEKIKEETNSNAINTSEQNTNQLEENKQNKEKIETERMLQVKTLKQENPDIIGWLEIKGTTVSYPVLQGTDNEFYMNHNYKKEKSRNGSIFLSKDYNWNIPSSNLLIYGHNLQNGTMFQELLKYSSENFYKEHPVINFATENEDAEYEIISVFKSRVYYKSEKNVFRYYYFINAETEAEYNEFVENAKKESLYNIEATAKYGEQLITLSTCSYHVKDGRFAVVGRKISNSQDN